MRQVRTRTDKKYYKTGCMPHFHLLMNLMHLLSITVISFCTPTTTKTLMSILLSKDPSNSMNKVITISIRWVGVTVFNNGGRGNFHCQLFGKNTINQLHFSHWVCKLPFIRSLISPYPHNIW